MLNTIVLPPSIMPVVILQGSEYSMGHQYGQQVPEYISLRRDIAWAKALRFGDKRHPPLSDQESVLHDLKAWQHVLREHAPNVIPFMRGVADGATAAGYQVSYRDVLLINTGVRRGSGYHYPSGAEQIKLEAGSELDDCYTLAAWGSATIDGRLICGDSFDGPWAPMVAIVAFPKEGNSYLTVCDAGEISSHPAMNDCGVFIGQAGGRTPGYPFNSTEPSEQPYLSSDNGYGINWRIAHKQLAQFSSNAQEAAKKAMEWPIAIPENFCCTDINGNGFNVEKTAAKGSVRKAGDFGETDFIYAGNGFFNAEMVPEEADGLVEFVEHAGYGTRRSDQPIKGDYTISRNLIAWNMLYNYHGDIDAEFVKMIWRFPGATKPGWERTVIGRNDSIGNKYVVVGVPDEGGGGIAQICTGPAAREMLPSGWSRGISGTHSFFELSLPRTPIDVVMNARFKAREETAGAWQRVTKLRYDNPGYRTINDLYSQAMTDYYEGDYYRNRSVMAVDQELLYLSKAATAYCRAQAHFRQLTNILEPPATTPEDLGLKPWGFWEESSGLIDRIDR